MLTFQSLFCCVTYMCILSVLSLCVQVSTSAIRSAAVPRPVSTGWPSTRSGRSSRYPPPPPRYPVGSNLAPQSAARSDIKGSVSDPGFFPDPDQTFLIFLSPDPDRPNIRIRIREKNVHWSKSRIFFIYISYLL